MALYPNLLVSYLSMAFGVAADDEWSYGIKIGAVLLLTLLNLAGLRVVGTASLVGSVIMIAPFLLVTIWSIPHINPSNWVQRTPSFGFAVFLNTALWNLTGWESVR